MAAAPVTGLEGASGKVKEVVGSVGVALNPPDTVAADWLVDVPESLGELVATDDRAVLDGEPVTDEVSVPVDDGAKLLGPVPVIEDLETIDPIPIKVKREDAVPPAESVLDDAPLLFI